MKLACARRAGHSAALDLRFLCQWVAFNALFGQWNQALQEPVAENQCWRTFVVRMVKRDQGGQIATALTHNRPLVMSIFEDEFLSRHFWQEPTGKGDGHSRKTMFNARTWFIERRWLLILERLFERMHFLCCQMVHGASTFKGSLNRAAIDRCSQAMDHLLRAFLRVWIDFGSDEDWGPLCYPPLKQKAGAR
jgi:hypothetical protein